MSIAYLTCDECGEAFDDCSEYYYCDGCGKTFCGDCEEESGVLYDEKKLEYVSCKYCRKEDFDIETCYKKSLELLKMTDEQIKKLLKKGK